MTYFLHIFPPYIWRRTFSINWTFCIFFIVFSRFLDFSYQKKWLVPNRRQERVIKVYQRRLRVQRAEKAVKVALAVVEVEVVVVAVAVPLVVVTEIEKYRVDISFNNWKIDLPLQCLSGKSHTYGLSRKCGNCSILQNYVYRNIRWQGRSF